MRIFSPVQHLLPASQCKSRWWCMVARTGMSVTFRYVPNIMAPFSLIINLLEHDKCRWIKILDFTLMVKAHDPGNSPAKAVDGIQGGKLGHRVVVVLPRVVVEKRCSCSSLSWRDWLNSRSRLKQRSRVYSVARWQTGDEEAIPSPCHKSIPSPQTPMSNLYTFSFSKYLIRAQECMVGWTVLASPCPTPKTRVPMYFTTAFYRVSK